MTVGSVLPPGSSSAPLGQVQTFFNTALPEKGANLVSPVSGTIVRWRMVGGVGGPFYLRVLRPNGSGAYAGAGTSGPATPTEPGLQTFAASIPIHAGDLLGIDPTNAGDEIGLAPVAGASYAFIFPPIVEGATVAPSGTESGKEIELSAEIQPAPSITEIAPRSGSIAGGTTVTITGTNLTSANAVKFGSTPASGFTVISDTQITATAPRTSLPGVVDVAVTTPAGASPLVRADRFTYEACIVPKLKGKTLKIARKKLKAADCKLGKVRGKKTKSARVKSQHPKPGKALALGAKVNVKLGR